MLPTSKYDWGRKPTPIKERIMKSISIDSNSCWVWQGKPTSLGGYIKILVGSRRDGSRKAVMAHRLSYETFVGKIPDGLTLDHLCDNPPCVNPEHLKPATIWDNTKRSKKSPTAVNARKLECPKCSSEYSPKKDGSGRYCRTCLLDYHRNNNKNRPSCARKL